MSGKKPLSLYVHIPFCTKKCHYCHFYVIPDNSNDHAILLQALLNHWNEWLPTIHEYEIQSLYFGGGTPYLFGAEAIHRIISLVRPHSNPIEITLEANPENITQEEMKQYFEAGVNRVSIGVQSLNDALLNTLTRTHDAAKAMRAIEMTYAAGIENISIDLMYDIPHQTLEQWRETLKHAIALPIRHLSLYNLTIEPHTQFFKRQDSLLPHIPQAEVSKEMYLEAIHTMESAGFRQYEISAFAKPGYESKHNSGYWTGREFIGLGPSAFSYLNGERFQNVPHLKKYSENREPTFRERLDENARRRELLILRLRLLEGVNIPSFISQYGELEQETRDEIEKLIGDELLEKDENILKLSQKGKLFYDTVATSLC